MDARFRPLPVWGHKETPSFRRRSRSTFKASFTQTLNLLQREIENLGGSHVIIGTFHRTEDIRLDGWPRSNANMPPHPGVEVSFDSRHGRLTYATDVCDYWAHNLRSIALGLEALRAVDRYGCTMQGEQYAGFRALPAGPPGEDFPETVTEAFALLTDVTNRDRGEIEYIGVDVVLRDALKLTHPDTGGDDLLFRRVVRAREILEVGT